MPSALISHHPPGVQVWFRAAVYPFSWAEIGATTSLAHWRVRLCALTGVEPAEQCLRWVGWNNNRELPLRVGAEVRADGGPSVEEALTAVIALTEARAELGDSFGSPSRSCLLLLRHGESSTKGIAFMLRVVHHWQQARLLNEQAVQRVRASGVVPVARLERTAEDHLASVAGSSPQAETTLEEQATSRDSMPVAEICYTAAVVSAALRWFKREHFQWVHCPSCDRCGAPTTRLIGLDNPNASEATYAASRVEVYECSSSERGCGQHVRFPRYNDAVYLLTQSRRGRCGEWAQSFALALRVCSVPRVRLVFDFEDHIWTEFWSESLDAWIHADPCEEVLHEPHLYSRGWGKALSWVVAIEVGLNACHLEDRSRVYTPPEDWPGMEQRQERIAGDVMIASGLLRLLAALSEGELYETVNAAVIDQFDAGASASVPQTALRPRESGAPEWIAQRGENGPRSQAPE
jgi:peptide-N4-(N-acetyl-beta-glucosaminyl)asparagine amidase